MSVAYVRPEPITPAGLKRLGAELEDLRFGALHGRTEAVLALRLERSVSRRSAARVAARHQRAPLARMLPLLTRRSRLLWAAATASRRHRARSRPLEGRRAA